MEKGGVDIDKPKVLVEVLPHCSTSKSLFGNSVIEPIPLLFPVVTILSDTMARKGPIATLPARVRKALQFSVGEKALFVGRGPFFGSMCEVKELLEDGNARVFFSQAREAAREIPFGYDVVDKFHSQRWKTLPQVASKCSLPVGVANAFLGSVRVRTENGKDEIDLGLGIKYASRGLLIPGFAKNYEYGPYFFSDKAITLLNRYKATFPELFAIMDKLMHSRTSKGAPVYEPKLLFPNSKNASDAVKSLASWVSASEVATQPLSPSSSQVLPRDAVFDLERNSQIARTLQDELSKQIGNGGKSGVFQLVSQKQLRSGSESLDWDDPTAVKNHLCLDPVPVNGLGLRIGDRVVNRLAYTGTPFGLRGTVIGLHNQKSVNNDTLHLWGKRRRQKSPPPQSITPTECTVEVVFDEEFIGGGSLNGLCSLGKGKAVPASSLYTIRPDRDNGFYTSNYARVAKNIKKPVNGAENSHRRRAIASAAKESFRLAIEPRSPSATTRPKAIEPRPPSSTARPNVILQDDFGKEQLSSLSPKPLQLSPKRSPMSKERNHQQIEQSVFPSSMTGVSEPDDEAAAL
eukprot:IDg12664t1